MGPYVPQRSQQIEKEVPVIRIEGTNLNRYNILKIKVGEQVPGLTKLCVVLLKIEVLRLPLAKHQKYGKL